MKVWETEDETPVRASSRHRGGRRSRKNSVSPVAASSPDPMPEFNSRRESKNMAGNEENISPFDPRRFTPTLHANLVAEILNLRRDQEDKMKAIEGLEESLFTSRNEIDALSTTAASSSKENRSLKRQLALLEGGTSSALTELAKERNEAVENATETKKRLETAQKKARSQEESADRAHELWAKDKDAWDEERRKLERKIHVAENRLKIVLDEVATYQARNPVESETDELTRDGNGSDTSSLHSRHQSVNSIRFSMFPGGGKPEGLSLADELNFEDDDELIQLNNEARDSLASFQSHRRQSSRDSITFRSHNYSTSIDSLRRPASVARSRMLANQAVLDKLEGRIAETDEEEIIVEKPVYVESSTQFSPPPSPVMKATVAGPGLQMRVKEVMIAQVGEKEANQRRKRAPAAALSPIEPAKTECMVSAGCQTMDEPLSPPRTPKVESLVLAPEVIRDIISSSTQTDGEWMLVPEVPESPKQIPFISIHPPTSRPPTPSSPREQLLPQHFKDFGCQVSIQAPAYTSTASVQTEEIRVDKRLKALPLHLQPSSITSCPPSPEPSNRDSASFSPPLVVPPPRNPRRMKSNQSFQDFPSSPPAPHQSRQSPESETWDSYPGNNDNGPLSHEKGFIFRPPRTSSLFAGFDNDESDEAEEFPELDQSDSDYTTALSAPRPCKSIRKMVRGMATTPVPEGVEPIEEEGPGDLTPSKQHFVNGPASPLRSSPNILDPKMNKSTIRHFDKPLSLVMPPPRQGTMRRSALVSSGIAAHTGRPRSPSLPMSDNEPPFPIPTRASSRKPPFSVSAPSDSNRSPTRDAWPRRRGGGHGRANSIRKTRSAAALPQVKTRRNRRGSRSTPPLSPSTEAPESPQLPPMPSNEITSPYIVQRDMHSSYRGQSGHRKQPSNYTANTAVTANTNQSAGSSVQATSVVDAIAQTMVGEWMFKYVRRRKSFGVAGANDIDDTANGARHKRWVWLAPYERAVMWSSKQPTSGSALMGKSGRKLTIQSVLDVKDDNAPPKGATNIFNRSILILTPARALKFTATTRERHYIWLTALSFLAHSSQAVPEVMMPHSVPSEEFLTARPPNGARLQKSPLRDSIRVAKGRGAVSTRSGPTTAQSSIHRGAESSTRTGISSRTWISTNGDQAQDVASFHTRMDSAIEEAASPPVIPRCTDRALVNVGGGHGRKRSNTGSRIPPPLSFRGFSERAIPTLGAFGGNINAKIGPPSTHSSNLSSYGSGHAPQSSTAGMSDRTATESDVYNPSYQSMHAGSAFGGNSISFSNGTRNSGMYGTDSFAMTSNARSSDASSRPGAVVNNFFEAVGTVRMEAFISPMAFTPQVDGMIPTADDMIMNSISRGGTNRRRTSRERRRRSRNRDSFYAKHRAPNIDYDDYYGGSKTAGEEEFRSQRSGRSSRADDPFRGF